MEVIEIDKEIFIFSKRVGVKINNKEFFPGTYIALQETAVPYKITI